MPIVGVKDESEIHALRSCLNDLVAIVSLPAIWPGEDAPQIITKLLEVMQRMLQLDFAYACLPEVPGREAFEIAKFASLEEPANRTREIGRALLPRLTRTADPNASANAAVLRGLSVTVFQLGLQENAGWLAVGSQRPDFPTKTEYLLLGVAANNTTLELEKAHALRQQKQVAVELDRLVAQRTKELEKTNATLREEITERELAEKTLEALNKELAESRNDLDLLINNIPAHVWCAFPDGSTAFQNQSWLQYAGAPPEATRSWGWSDTLHPEDIVAYVAKWSEIHASEQPGQAEARFRRHDGQYRWFLTQVVPVRENGTITKWYGTNTDIDDLKRAETILAGEKELFEMVATGHSLPAILETLCRIGERLAERSMLSILLLDEDGQHLRHCAAPSLPEAYTRRIDGISIGPAEGSCGRAAYLGENVFASDMYPYGEGRRADVRAS